MNSSKKIEAAEKLVIAAKQMGFLKARVAYWDAENSEYSNDTLREIVDEYLTDEEIKVHLGIFLTFDDEPIKAMATYVSESGSDTAIMLVD